MGIDVLAVMAAAHDGSLTTANNEMWQARAAVAELIEQTKVLTSAATDSGLMRDTLAGMRPHEAETLRQAILAGHAVLARVAGGAA